jgi:hemolysin III
LRREIKLHGSVAIGGFGGVFHAWRRLRFQNVIWHCFVLLGAACHYIAVLALVLA